MTITWHLYRTKQGSWVIYSDTPAHFTSSDKRVIEKRLIKLGMRPTEIEQLFKGEREKGEGRVTVPIGLERLDEEGLLEQED